MDTIPIFFKQMNQFSQSLSSDRLFETPWTAALQASLSITISRSLLRVTSIESVMPSNKYINAQNIQTSNIYQCTKKSDLKMKSFNSYSTQKTDGSQLWEHDVGWAKAKTIKKKTKELLLKLIWFSTLILYIKNHIEYFWAFIKTCQGKSAN